MRKFLINTKRGVSLFEVVVAIGIITVVILSVVVAFQFYMREGVATLERVQALSLAEEGVEAMRFMRDQDWDTNIASLGIGTPYYLTFDVAGWSTSTDPSMVDGVFTRTVTLADVYRRDSDSDIVPEGTSGSTLDPDSRRVIVEVEWVGAVARTRSARLENILTNLAGS